jgi:uncharacterized protein YcnI
MRAAVPLRLLLTSAVLLSAACDEGSFMPQEPTLPGDEIPIDTPIAEAGSPRWAAGYLHAGSPTSASYAPLPYLSYNASGGTMNVTKPAGTTGRYVVTFTGLSALLGTKSTVHVTEYGLNDTYCKPANGRLVEDKLEVRCFRASTGQAANTAFTVVVLGRASNAIFAYAHQPTTTSYLAAAAGSFNPKGGVRVARTGLGKYTVTWDNYASSVPAGNNGNAQVSAVGTGKAHCGVEEWGNSGTPNFNLYVRCYTPAGLPTDSKFAAFFQIPHPNVAYVMADRPTEASYPAQAGMFWNPIGDAAWITRTGVGDYTVTWNAVDAAIKDGGTVQVTSAWGDVQCKATGLTPTGASVHCFGPQGVRADATFMLLIGS